MERLSVPIEPTLHREFNSLIPWGVRHKLIVGLIRIALLGDRGVLWAIAAGDSNNFEIKRKEKVNGSNSGLEPGS
jgi:hypothetical protein